MTRTTRTVNAFRRSFRSRVPAALRGRRPGGGLGALAAVVLMLTGAASMQAQTSTTTNLTITAGGSSVSSVSAKTVVTLTAAVQSGGAPVTSGVVNFCDAAATYCEDSHLVGTAQLMSSGTAIYRFTPGLGSHVYKAVFVGSHAAVTSMSGTSTLTVTGLEPAATSLMSSGSSSSYTLTATVGGNAAAPPSGMVSFVDTTNANALLGSASLTSATGPGLVSIPTNVSPGGTAVTADFNGDGIPDIAEVVVAPSSEIHDNQYNINVYLGKGDGTFTAGQQFVVAYASSTPGLAVGDFNQDGHPDLAVTYYNSYGGYGRIAIELGNGDGTFAVGQMLSASSSGGVSAIGDFNGDGIPDILSMNAALTDVYFGNGDGTFATSPVTTSANGGGSQFILADFNGDGKLDVAEWNVNVDILLGNGDGTFTVLNSGISLSYGYGTNSIINRVVEADFNGDGVPDLAYCDVNSHLFLLTGNGDGTFASTVVSSANTCSALETYDFNGDGLPDLLPVGVTAAFLNNGNGTFTGVGLPVANSATTPTVTADFNGDGVVDQLYLGVSYPVVSSAVLFTAHELATASISGVALAPNSGSHQIVTTYSGDGDYSAGTPGSLTLTSPLATPTVTLSFTTNPVPYGMSEPVTVTVSGMSGTTPTGTIGLAYSGQSNFQTLTLTNGVATTNFNGLYPGQNTYVANYSGDANYRAYTSAPVTLTINPAPPTITFSVANMMYGASPFTASASSNSSGGFTYSVVSGPATIYGSTVTLTGTGTVVLLASQSADNPYTAGTKTATFTVTGGAPTISFSVPNMTYGAAPFTVAATSNSSGALYYFVESGPATISGSTVTLTGAGTVLLGVGQSASGIYNSSSATALFTVSTASLTATAVSASKVVGTANPTLTYALSGFVGNDTSTVVSGSATLTTTATANSPVGSYPVTFASENLSATNYTISYVPGILTVVSPLLNYGSGFSSAAGLSLVGATVPSGGTVLQLTDGGSGENHAAWYATPVSVQAFTTDFTFQITPSPSEPMYLADGFTFTMQNSQLGPYVAGVSGGGLGYAGIGSSVAVKFDLNDNAGEGNDSTGFYTNGANPTVPAVDMTSSGVNLHSGDVMHAHITYDGTNLTLVVTDTVTNASFTTTTPINIPNVVGGSTAYVGFTGGTGGFSAVQNILSWTYAAGTTAPAAATPTFSPLGGTYTSGQTVTISDATSGAAIYYTTDGSQPTMSSMLYTGPISVSATETINAIAVEGTLYANSSVGTAAYTIVSATTLINYPTGFTTAGLSLVGATIPPNGTVLQLTDGGTGENNAAWFPTTVEVQSFVTDFTFQITPSPASPTVLADGFTFTLQNSQLGPYVAGVPGGGLGSAGIGSSISVKFDLYSNAGEGNNSTGLYIDGANPTTPAIDMTSSGVDLHSGHVMHAHISYDGTSLALILTDTVTNASFATSWAINIPLYVKNGVAYAGFTAGTGSYSAIQDILTWTYAN